MSAAVLISIKPKWCHLIASGKKTTEVRKTRPKLETPFKCYIYCTAGHPYISVRNGKLDKLNYRTNTVGRCNGKVIGEFVCDGVITDKTCGHDELLNNAACITEEEASQYADGKSVFGWHISNLKIYDVPRELTKVWAIKRAPQSWCYVEEMQ